LVRIVIDRDENCWRGTSPDIPGFNAFGDSLEEVRKFVQSGVRFALETDEVEIHEILSTELPV
jgi:predicted RNase H-like HicB family nuclease